VHCPLIHLHTKATRRAVHQAAHTDYSISRQREYIKKIRASGSLAIITALNHTLADADQIWHQMARKKKKKRKMAFV
jgi:hypothetical protein